MTESKKRRVHPPEFKAKVGLEALGGTKTINQITQAYGVLPIQVGQWKREIQAQAKSLFEGKRVPQPVSAESQTSSGGGAMIVDKYRSQEKLPVALCSSGTAAGEVRIEI
jgi:transposase